MFGGHQSTSGSQGDVTTCQVNQLKMIVFVLAEPIARIRDVGDALPPADNLILDETVLDGVFLLLFFIQQWRHEPDLVVDMLHSSDQEVNIHLQGIDIAPVVRGNAKAALREAQLLSFLYGIDERNIALLIRMVEPQSTVRTATCVSASAANKELVRCERVVKLVGIPPAGFCVIRHFLKANSGWRR